MPSAPASSFVVDADFRAKEALSDTSRAEQQVPLYDVPAVAALSLPRGCRLVGVELVDEAVALPSFRHPLNAAYVFGPERGSLSPGHAGALRPCGARPDALLRQSGGRRCHRHV